MPPELAQYAPLFQPDSYTETERYLVEPFFTNLDQAVYVILILPPELVGALLSRTSRTNKDLRKILLDEFLMPVLRPSRDEKDTQATWQEKLDQAKSFLAFINFLHRHSYEKIFSNKRAREFYIKWLAQFGDDSIAQLSGQHLVFTGLSQIAIKHFEDMRIGIAPIEKSTRYLAYDKKVADSYLYYSNPKIADYGLLEEFQSASDKLFETYSELIPRLSTWLAEKFPNEDAKVIEKKSFDTLRGLLPTATLSQVAFFANGQAFEHLMNRSLEHPIGEIRWAANRAKEELTKTTPSFFMRINEPQAKKYQHYLAGKSQRVLPMAQALNKLINNKPKPYHSLAVSIVDHDDLGLEKIITSIIYGTTGYHQTWADTFEQVMELDDNYKEKILSDYLAGRDVKWMKVGRAFEMTDVIIEIIINIGAWRDLHRHRMLTQIRQSFSCYHGYDVPDILIESGLDQPYRDALDQMTKVFYCLAQSDTEIAQYACCLAHRIRFIQKKNIRECFWEGELRTIPEGHPDYRHIEQLIFLELEKIFPIITEHMLVNMNEYDFARRGQDQTIQDKEKQLEKLLQ